MKDKDVLENYIKEIKDNYFNRKEQEKTEIIVLWYEGLSFKGIESKGYSMKDILHTLDEYTKENAKEWLK